MVEEILQFGTTGKNLTEKEAMWKFYQYLAFPLQGVCKCVIIFLVFDIIIFFQSSETYRRALDEKRGGWR